jgi:hypothetical protein
MGQFMRKLHEPSQIVLDFGDNKVEDEVDKVRAKSGKKAEIIDISLPCHSHSDTDINDILTD